MKKKIGALFLLMCSSIVGFAQETTQKHVVVKGETITQIAKNYQTTANELFLLNPNAVNGINENQILLIPNKVSGALKHEVIAQETIYGISKKYNIAIDQLYLFNPGLKEDGLKIGQFINLTKIKSQDKASTTSLYKEVEVKEKETLYSLASQYETAISILYELNPNLEKEGLKKGQLLKVPIAKKEQATNVKPVKTEIASEFIIVQPKETIFGIAKRLNVSQDELIKLNPELKDGLKEGMRLTIKKTNGSVVEQLVDSNINVIASDLTSSKKKNKTAELTLLLPFNISDDIFSNKSSLNKRLNSDIFLNMTLDFYSGALIAIDSAKAMNLPIHINIIDSKESNRSLNVENLKKQIDFSSTDVVIGPFFQKNVDAFSEVFQNQDLLIVSPLSTEEGKPYPNQVHSMPNNGVIKETMMEYLKSKNGNIIAVLNPKSASNKTFYSQNFPQVKLVSTAESGAINLPNIESQIIAGKTNFVILDSNSLKSAIDLINNLKKLQKKYDVRLVVIEKTDVLDSTEINIQDLVDLKFTFPSITNESTNNTNEKFENAFKKKFNIAPNRFAVRGFDVTMDVISRMIQSDQQIDDIFGYGTEQIENKFTYVEANGGIFNSGIYILKYDKDLTIKEAE